MSDESILELVRQAIEGQVLVSWRFYLVLVAVVFLTTAASNFLAAYFRTRGARYATKADFDELLNELRESTKATEEIKRTISHEAWLERERSITRRGKLEDLLRAVYELHLWLDREKDHALFDGSASEVPDPTYKIEIVGGLYFGELDEELSGLKLAALEYKRWLVRHKAKLAPARVIKDYPAMTTALQEAASEYPEVYQKLVYSTAALEARAKTIMEGALAG